MSAIGIIIVFTGLIPTEITTLGIKFAEADRKSLLFIFAFVVGYFLFAFLFYALSDYLEWVSARRGLSLGRRRRDLQQHRAEVQEYLDARAWSQEQPDATGKQELVDVWADLNREERLIAEESGASFGFTWLIITLRFYFEFILPPVVAVFAIVALLTRAL
jgi:hypothetical protein